MGRSKKNTQAKEGLKEKTFRLKFFVNYCEDFGQLENINPLAAKSTQICFLMLVNLLAQRSSI